MNKVQLIESFDDLPSVSLTENQQVAATKVSRVDGKYIIGMIEGQFFKPDGMSRNERFYPKELWENAVNSADVKNRCRCSTMFGEIGHSDGPVGDMTLRNGCASHFIDELWITPKNEGMGRAYILNTPTGNLLKTYLGAGCKLKVSSRGEGMYSESVTKDGHPVIDPNSYELQTFDFVLNPGFLETNAQLKEEYDRVTKSPILNEEIKTVINHVKKGEISKMTLDTEKYIQELKEELAAVKAENKSLTESLNAKEKELLQKQFVENEEVKKLTEAYAPYKKLNVSAKTITETFKKTQSALSKAKAENTKLTEELEVYKKEAGTIEELHEATRLASKALSMVKEYRALGSVAELKALKESASDKETVEELKENAKKAIKMVKESKELEAVAEKACVLLESYKKLGSVAELTALVKASKANSRKVSVKEAKELSTKFNISIENAGKLINKYGTVEKVSSLLESKLAAKADAKEASKVEIKESSELIAEEAKSDKAKAPKECKTAKDFLTPGMLNNKFNPDAFGKEIGPVDINDLGAIKAKTGAEILDKYKTPDVDKTAVKTDKPATPEEAEKAVKALLKK